MENRNHTRPVSLSGVALDGNKLVRLVYLDESGISINESVAVVAGIVVDADVQWKLIEQYISALVDVYVPEEHRAGFAFHATDLYHGGGPVFDRRKYPLDKARKALKKLIELPAKAHLPLVWGYFRKYPEDEADRRRSPRRAAADDQSWAFTFCAVAAEKYMRKYAPPSEIAALIAENNNDTRKAVKEMHTILRGRNLPPAATDLLASIAELSSDSLPLQRIIDSVYFAEKDDAALLQLADACALIIRFALQRKPNCQEFFDSITGNHSEALLADAEANHAGGAWNIDFGPLSKPAVA